MFYDDLEANGRGIPANISAGSGLCVRQHEPISLSPRAAEGNYLAGLQPWRYSPRVIDLYLFWAFHLGYRLAMSERH